MKAFTTRGDGIAALRFDERPTPTPGRSEVVVRIIARVRITLGTGDGEPKKAF